MKQRYIEYSLRASVKHLDYLYSFGVDDNLMYSDVCDCIHKIFTRQLEPLRLQYREGRLNERIHNLLTEGYKYAYLTCKEYGIAWPPPSKARILIERLSSYENEYENLIRDFENIKNRIDYLKYVLKHFDEEFENGTVNRS